MTDLEFVRSCVKKDKQAWPDFIAKYSRLIYNYIHSVLKIKGARFTQENIDDLFQDIFLALVRDDFKKLKSFRAKNNCSLASWLRQVTVNFTIDYLRALHPTVSLEEEIGEEACLKDLLPDDRPGQAQGAADKEKLGTLAECIDGLSGDDKYFLKLHLGKNLAPKELTGHLGASRGALEMRRKRIIDRLRECFQSKGFVLEF
jgi:RNA polymerase sigma factor (sigma-70 family)